MIHGKFGHINSTTFQYKMEKINILITQLSNESYSEA